MSERAKSGEAFAMVSVNTHHSTYVDDGALTDANDDMALGKLLFVMDRDGWATLHRVESFGYRCGRRVVTFGPRIAWPDGRWAARNVNAFMERAS